MVDALVYEAVSVLEKNGATVIPIDQINSPKTRDYSLQVMIHEYKDGLNDYFTKLGEESPIKSLEELIEFNKQDAVELKYYNQTYLEQAQQSEGMK